MKTITLANLIDAMEKNGYPQGFGGLFIDKYGKRTNSRHMVAACALGQGILNLNLKGIRPTYNAQRFANFIKRVAHLNDIERLTPDQIAVKVRKEFEKDLDMSLEVRSKYDKSKVPFSQSSR